jgi:hypothetical protein
VRACKLCARIADCSPLLELFLSGYALLFAVVLVVHPTLMAESRAWSAMLDWAPQWAWAVAFLAVGMLKAVALLLVRPRLQLAALGAGVALWTLVAYGVGFQPESPSFARYVYGYYAFGSWVCACAVAWHMGARHV